MSMKLLNEIDELKDALIGRDIENDRLTGRLKELRQQLAVVTSQRDGLNHLCEFNERTMGRLIQQLTDSQKQVTLLRDALRHLWNERTPDSLDEAGEALAATADLDEFQSDVQAATGGLSQTPL